MYVPCFLFAESRPSDSVELLCQPLSDKFGVLYTPQLGGTVQCCCIVRRECDLQHVLTRTLEHGSLDFFEFVVELGHVMCVPETGSVNPFCKFDQ